MVHETNEDFGLGDRNFHPEEQRLNSEAMQNEDLDNNRMDQLDSFYEFDKRDKDLDNYTRNDYDPYQDDLDGDDINKNVDKNLDDNGESEESDEDFNEKDKSDY